MLFAVVAAVAAAVAVSDTSARAVHVEQQSSLDSFG